ncbi:MAG: hypothetical protein CMI01_18775 [Oceanospirillaceae bacterium]|nr:hypothetical protein [Oceanospirillaceae bacterium]
MASEKKMNTAELKELNEAIDQYLKASQIIVDDCVSHYDPDDYKRLAVNLPTQLHRHVKTVSATTGVSIRDLVIGALLTDLKNRGYPFTP